MSRPLVGRFAARHEPRPVLPGALSSTADDDEIQRDLAPAKTNASFGSRGGRTGLRSLRAFAGQSALQPLPTTVHFGVLTHLPAWLFTRWLADVLSQPARFTRQRGDPDVPQRALLYHPDLDSLSLLDGDGTPLTTLQACLRISDILPYGTIRRRLRTPFLQGPQAGFTGG